MESGIFLIAWTQRMLQWEFYQLNYMIYSENLEYVYSEWSDEKMDKNQLGVQYMQEGKWEEAARIFNEVIEENPQDAIAYINFGNVLSAVGDDEKALKFYEKAIELDENAAAAYYSAGNIYFSNEKFEQAKNMFEHGYEKRSSFQ